MSSQTEYMARHHQWNDKVREIENRIADAKNEGRNWRGFENELANAKHHSALNYELATDRGY